MACFQHQDQGQDKGHKDDAKQEHRQAHPSDESPVRRIAGPRHRAASVLSGRALSRTLPASLSEPSLPYYQAVPERTNRRDATARPLQDAARWPAGSGPATAPPRDTTAIVTPQPGSLLRVSSEHGQGPWVSPG